MFKELVPILRQRAVLLTVTFLDEDQIRVNIVPKKIKDGDNDALTTPLSVTGTAEELDAELSSTIVSFVASHLQLKNTLERAKAEMDEAAKAAQAEVRAKSKVQPKKEPARTVTTRSEPERANLSDLTKLNQPRQRVCSTRSPLLRRLPQLRFPDRPQTQTRRTTSWLKLRANSKTKRTSLPKHRGVLSFKAFGRSYLASLCGGFLTVHLHSEFACQNLALRANLFAVQENPPKRWWFTEMLII
jgi:PRTRC genetic system protein E